MRTNINLSTPLSELTVEEFLELQKQLYPFSTTTKKYEYGIKGLAKILGCGRTTASKIKKSGLLDDAISQNGKILVIDREKALQLLKTSKRR